MHDKGICLAAVVGAALLLLIWSWGQADGRSVWPGARLVGVAQLYLVFADLLVDCCDQFLEREVDVVAIQGTCLCEQQLVLRSELLGLLGGDGTQVSQIGLVPDQTHSDVVVGVLPQLRQPVVAVLVTAGLADVVHDQRTHGTTVVCGGDRTVPFLARGVPYLRLNLLAVHVDGPSGKLDTDSGLRVDVELIRGEPRQQVRLTNTGVTNQHYLEQIVVVITIILVAHLGI